jgi:tetratricopeptide (TPR) repeat protein
LLQIAPNFWDNLHILVMNSLAKPKFLYFCGMKRINYLLITLLLAACSKTDKQLISEAETMVGQNADSALCVLNKVEDATRLKGEWKARYWMAMAQAHIGTYQALSEDSLVLYAAEYYQDKDSAMLCKAHALASSYYWWRDSFAKAKDMMRLSVEESKRANDREGTISKLRSLARMESLEGNLDGLKRYTEEVVKLDGGDKNQAKLLNSLAIEYFYHGNYDAAIATMERIVAYRDTAADSIYIWNDVMRNYADMLVAMGQLDKGIQLQEYILDHYQHSTILEDNKIGALFSLSHAWLLKGDKQKARQYMDMVDEEKATDATRFCMIAHRMVLNYATTGRYDMTEIAEYANNKRDKR